MKQTEDLIAELSARGAAPAAFPRLRFLAPLAAAMVVCAAIMASLLGAPFSAIGQVGASPYVTKWAFSLSLTGGGAWALYALARPGRGGGRRLAILALFFAIVLLSLIAETLVAPSAFPGETWRRCVAAILLLSPLCFAATMWAVRRLAPTSLRLAGLAAGLFSGGAAATAYAPWCPEIGAAYLAAFYAGPILLVAIAGLLIGPRALRW